MLNRVGQTQAFIQLMILAVKTMHKQYNRNVKKQRNYDKLHNYM